jgi:hypothetical protein
MWQSGIRVLGVFSSADPDNAWLFLANNLGNIGWRQIQPYFLQTNPRETNGVVNILQIAIMAHQTGAEVQCFFESGGSDGNDVVGAIQLL